MTVDDRLENIKTYFAEKLATHGATPRGVDYNSVQSQELRFEQILKVCDPTQPFSLLDYGCGFGSLADLMTRKGWSFTYTGYDVLPAMIDKAIELHRDQANCAFTTQANDLIEADYV
ncbi:MAG TPA: class I SAM-dependent methyltransferase, partial [Anaerolineaceae bacterium]|nr:class I SAM-dependent methyltransferase [Anaerolineaceae bacterium]